MCLCCLCARVLHTHTQTHTQRYTEAACWHRPRIHNFKRKSLKRKPALALTVATADFTETTRRRSALLFTRTRRIILNVNAGRPPDRVSSFSLSLSHPLCLLSPSSSSFHKDARARGQNRKHSYTSTLLSPDLCIFCSTTCSQPRRIILILRATTKNLKQCGGRRAAVWLSGWLTVLMR